MDSLQEIGGKEIAVVGGSHILKNQNKGDFIDAFDYVVKFNGALNLHNNSDYTKDYGKRDDIHFLTNPYVKEMKMDLDNFSLQPYYLFKKSYPQYKKIKYENIGGSIQEIEKGIQKGFVYSGIATIYHLLKFNPKKIHLFGMDMYVEDLNSYNGDWSRYPEGYIPEKMKKLTDKLHADGHLSHSRYWNSVVLNEMIIHNQDTFIYEFYLRMALHYILTHREWYL